MDDGVFEEEQILNNLEEMTEEVIFGALLHEMMAMPSSQDIISHYQPNVFPEKDSLSYHTICGSGPYVFDKVCFLPLNFT